MIGPFRADDGDRSIGGLTEGAKEPRPSVSTHLDHAVRDEADELVPLEIQRAGVVGLELEPAAFEPLDLAGDAIAVGERDDVGLALGGRRVR